MAKPLRSRSAESLAAQAQARAKLEQARVEQAQERAERLGITPFANQPGRLRFARGAGFNRAMRSKGSRPICPREGCGLPVPPYGHPDYLGWADSFGHRNKAGEPCRSFSMEEKLNYKYARTERPYTRRSPVSEVKSADGSVAKPDAPTLDKRERAFVKEYLVCRNASAAARRAGYSNPARDGVRVLEYPHVKAALGETAPAAAPAAVSAAPKARRKRTPAKRVARRRRAPVAGPKKLAAVAAPAADKGSALSHVGSIVTIDLALLPAGMSVVVDSRGVRMSVQGAA
jgi:Terminase small subunit